MDDEHGDVGPVTTGASEPTVGLTVPSETLVENLDCRNKIDESYNDGGGGEIMVEVVGSDVFVDGVSDLKEGDLGSGEVGELRNEDATQNFEGAINASADGVENNAEKSEGTDSNVKEVMGEDGGLSGPKLITQNVEVRVSELDNDGAREGRDLGPQGDDEVWSPIFGDGGSDLKEGVLGSTEVGESKGHTPDNRNEEDAVQDFQGATNASTVGVENKGEESEGTDSNVKEITGEEIALSKPNLITDQVEVRVSESENLGSQGDHEVQSPVNEDVTEKSAVNATEEGISNEDASGKDGENDAKPETLDHPVKVAGGEEDVVVHKEEILELDDNASDDMLVTESLLSHETTDAAADNEVAAIEASVDPTCEVANTEQLDEVDKSVGEVGLVQGDSEPLIANIQMEPSCNISASDEGRLVSGGDVLPAETSVAGDVIDGLGGVEREELRSNIIKPDVTVSDCKDESLGEKDSDSMNADTVVGSIKEQSSVSERGEVETMDVDGVVGIKDEGLGTNLPDMTCSSNDKILKSDGNFENDMVESCNEPNECGDGGDNTMINEGDLVKVEPLADMASNEVILTELKPTGDDDIVQTDSGLYTDQPPVTTVEVEVMNDKKVENSDEKVLDRAAVNQKGEEEVVTEAPLQSSHEHPGTVEVRASGTVEEPSTEPTDVRIADDDVMVDDSTVGDEVMACDSVEDNKSIQDEKQEGTVQITEQLTDGLDKDEIKNPIDANPIPNERASIEEDDHTEPTEEHLSETDQSKISDEELSLSSSVSLNRPRYQWLPENEDQFSVSDIVWGKVRSHPWWPGQIFDPSDASEKAMKYYKKDCFLVAYFGDRTFAWNDVSLLKPFRLNFSQIEKQSNSESFQNAVQDALEEVSRRVELGLACRCLPQEARDEIEAQIVENTGIREESSRRYGVDRSMKASSFEPTKLLDYVRELAPLASHGADRLDLVIAQSQLLAYGRFKGQRTQIEFVFSSDLSENDVITQSSDAVDDLSGKSASHKRKDTPMDSLQPRKKERSFKEIMGDTSYSVDGEGELDVKDSGRSASSSSARKRKTPESLSDGSDHGAIIHDSKASTAISAAPKPSFKIGECIRRVASQLTGPTPPSSGVDGGPQINEHSEEGTMVVPTELSSLDEILSQLKLAAKDPKNGHSYLRSNITFFNGFRSSIASNPRGRKKRANVEGGAGEFEFDDANDSYWTDRIVQNCSGEQLLQATENGGRQYPPVGPVPYEPEKIPNSGRRLHARKRYSIGNHVNESNEHLDKQKRESLPAELVLNFAERESLPSENNLTRIFRRFGPLMESKTEVDRDSGRAKVIFKKGSDAEVAFSSAGKFNIFGPVLVNYQLVHLPATSIQSSPLAICQTSAGTT